MEKLREQYEKEVVPALMKKFQYKPIFITTLSSFGTCIIDLY